MSLFDDAHTERTSLRMPVDADLEAIFRIHSDPRTNRYNPAGPDADRVSSSARLQGWIEHWEANDFGYWTVVVDGAIAGFAGLQRASWLDRPVLNLYYRFAPKFWGQGYGVEVARFAVTAGIAQFPLNPVLARTKADNVPSQRTARAAGLVRRQDLDREDGTGMAVILASSWNPTIPRA